MNKQAAKTTPGAIINENMFWHAIFLLNYNMNEGPAHKRRPLALDVSFTFV